MGLRTGLSVSWAHMDSDSVIRPQGFKLIQYVYVQMTFALKEYSWKSHKGGGACKDWCGHRKEEIGLIPGTRSVV